MGANSLVIKKLMRFPKTGDEDEMHKAPPQREEFPLNVQSVTTGYDSS